MSERSDYIFGLRALADALDADPGLRLPYGGATDDLSVFTYTAEGNAAYVALLAGAAVEYLRDDRSFPHRTTGTLGRLRLYVYGPPVNVVDHAHEALALELELAP